MQAGDEVATFDLDVVRRAPVRSVRAGVGEVLLVRRPGQDGPDEGADHLTADLLFMGRFVRFKNLYALIKAASLLPYVHLTLVGDGPLTHRITLFIFQFDRPANV